MSVNSGHHRTSSSCLRGLRGAMFRFGTWLMSAVHTLVGVPLGLPHESRNRKTRKSKMKRKEDTSDVGSKEMDDTSDVHTTTHEECRVCAPLIAGCSSESSHNLLSEAYVHERLENTLEFSPLDYNIGSLKATSAHAGLNVNVDREEGDCDEVDRQHTTLARLSTQSLPYYFNSTRTATHHKRHVIDKRGTKRSSKKNAEDKSNNHQLSDELGSVGQRALLCPVHHQGMDKSTEKTPSSASSSGQCLGISCDKHTSVTKDPLVLGRQGWRKSDNDASKNELSNRYGTMDKEGSHSQDMILPKQITVMGLDISSSCNIMCNEPDFDNAAQSKAHEGKNGSEPTLKSDKSRSSSSLELLARRSTSIQDIRQSDDIHLSSIGSMTPINFSETFIGHQLSRSASLSSIDDVSRISSEQAFRYDIQRCRHIGYNNDTSNQVFQNYDDFETLEGLFSKPIASGDLSDAMPFQKPSVEDQYCDDTEVNVCSKDAVVISVGNPQSRDSSSETDNTKCKSMQGSAKIPLTTKEKHRKAIMKRLANSTKATLAAYCSSGRYQNPEPYDQMKDSFEVNRNGIETDYMSDNKEWPMADMISHPKTDYLLQNCSEDTEPSEMAPILTSANNDLGPKAVVQNLWEETESEYFDSSPTHCSEHLFKSDYTSKGLDENKPDDGMHEYFAEGPLTDLDSAVQFITPSAQVEGCDETDGPREMVDSAYEIGSTSALSINSTTLMCAAPSSSDKCKMQTANTNVPFKTKRSRFHSFGGTIWKLSTPKVEEIVYSGFHYIGPGDKTQCFSCGIILMEWESTDIPVEEHLRHSPNCSFIKDVASFHKQWLSPFIEGAIDIVKGFNQFENAIIDTAIDHLDLKDVYIFTAPQLLDEIYLIEEDKEKEDISILYLYGIQGATCQDITDEILRDELLLKLEAPDPVMSDVDDDHTVFQPIEPLEDEIGGLGAGFHSFFEIPAVQSGKENIPMVLHEEYNEEAQNLDGHERFEEIFFSIHGEEERSNNVADKPENIVDNLSVPSSSNTSDVKHDSGCISDEESPQTPNDHQIGLMPEKVCAEDEELSDDTDYYSEVESEDEDQVDLTAAPEPVAKTEEEKVDMEARLVSLRQTNDELRLWSACKVCLVKCVSELYIDCGHLAVCSSCSGHLNACPICRKPITNSMTVYMH